MVSLTLTVSSSSELNHLRTRCLEDASGVPSATVRSCV